MTETDALRAQVAAQLLAHAEATGDCRFRSAAALLRGKKPGRKPKDAADTSVEIAALLHAGVARDVDHAARLVAAAAPGRIRPAAIARRYAADAPRIAA